MGFDTLMVTILFVVIFVIYWYLFAQKIELAAPQQYGSSIEKELFRAPLSKRKIKDKEGKS